MLAEQRLDHLVDTLQPDLMRAQQNVAGQRAKVLQIRSELLEIEMRRFVVGDERWTEVRESRDALFRAVKEAEQAARAASKQSADDDIRTMMRERDERSEARKRFKALP